MPPTFLCIREGLLYSQEGQNRWNFLLGLQHRGPQFLKMGGKEKGIVNKLLDEGNHKGCNHKEWGTMRTRLCTHVKEYRQEWYNAWSLRVWSRYKKKRHVLFLLNVAMEILSRFLNMLLTLTFNNNNKKTWIVYGLPYCKCFELSHGNFKEWIFTRNFVSILLCDEKQYCDAYFNWGGYTYCIMEIYPIKKPPKSKSAKIVRNEKPSIDIERGNEILRISRLNASPINKW